MRVQAVSASAHMHTFRLQVEAKEGDLIAALDNQLGDIVKFFMAKEAEMLGKLEQLELEVSVCVCGGGGEQLVLEVG